MIFQIYQSKKHYFARDPRVHIIIIDHASLKMVIYTISAPALELRPHENLEQVHPKGKNNFEFKLEAFVQVRLYTHNPQI